jgi:hypothetical protein
VLWGFLNLELILVLVVLLHLHRVGVILFIGQRRLRKVLVHSQIKSSFSLVVLISLVISLLFHIVELGCFSGGGRLGDRLSGRCSDRSSRSSSRLGDSSRATTIFGNLGGGLSGRAVVRVDGGLATLRGLGCLGSLGSLRDLWRLGCLWGARCLRRLGAGLSSLGGSLLGRDVGLGTVAIGIDIAIGVQLV